MRKAYIFPALIAAGLAAQSCQQKNQEKNMAEEVTADTTAVPAKVASCNVRMDGITFTGALNGADTCVTVKDGRAIEFRCTEKLDFFCDPNGGQLSNTTLPILLTEEDITQPFTLTAKVTPGFTTEGTYNAADLFVYANDTLWQKFAFEQDERGNHRIVTVRTQGTSDDNNHERLTVPSVYLKISSDTHTIASYYSLDQKEWQMVRLYKNYYPGKIWVGIASQCPQKGECTSLFEEVSLQQTAVSDFRMGE